MWSMVKNVVICWDTLEKKTVKMLRDKNWGAQFFYTVARLIMLLTSFKFHKQIRSWFFPWIIKLKHFLSYWVFSSSFEIGERIQKKCSSLDRVRRMRQNCERLVCRNSFIRIPWNDNESRLHCQRRGRTRCTGLYRPPGLFGRFDSPTRVVGLHHHPPRLSEPIPRQHETLVHRKPEKKHMTSTYGSKWLCMKFTVQLNQGIV